MRRLVWGFAGRTYHIVGNLMPRLNYFSSIKLRFYLSDQGFDSLRVIHVMQKQNKI